MKYLLIGLFFLIGSVTTTGCATEIGELGSGTKKTVVERNGCLSVRGTSLVNERGESIVLKGVSYGWHNWWPRFYNASTVQFLHDDWGYSVVRAAMAVEPEGAYIHSPGQALQCITTVADAAIASGIYVIIDWHSHSIRTEEARQFFTQMATRYKGIPNVIYEIFNEPVEDSWIDVKAYSTEIIHAIRTIDPEALILIGTPHWDQDVHLAADDPITGYTNIMYTLHFYASTHRQELRDRADYALKKGLPLFVSECAGMEATGDGPIDIGEWGRWLEWMKKHSISWAAWSIADKDETCSMIQKYGSSKGDWKDSDLKEWGTIIRDELKLTK